MSMSALICEILVGLPVDLQDALQVGLRPDATVEGVLNQVVVAFLGLLTFVHNPL